jgi:hypothetical protein
MNLDGIALVDDQALCGSLDAPTALLERWEQLFDQAQA